MKSYSKQAVKRGEITAEELVRNMKFRSVNGVWNPRILQSKTYRWAVRRAAQDARRG